MNEPAELRPRYRLSRVARIALQLCMSVVLIGRIILTFSAARDSNFEPLVSFGFTVVFPLLLCGLLLAMPPTSSSEGVLMRTGAIIQLLLIVCLPSFGLMLLLGLPVVFLVVEIFETRAPARLRDTIKLGLIQS